MITLGFTFTFVFLFALDLSGGLGTHLLHGFQLHGFQPPELVQHVVNDTVPELQAQFSKLTAAFISLPVATALGAALAFRPRRRGTPPRTANVIQTQVILAIVGALVMLIVGASLARAFGIVGAASLVRYRAKVNDPKDAGVMLATLAIGLASGVGLYLLAAFATLFTMIVLLWIESLEPRPKKLFELTVKTPNPEQLQEQIERVLRRSRADFELRTSAADVVSFEVELPFDAHTDSLSEQILASTDRHHTTVEWKEHKSKK
jgi:uncharacterized membrane protein YhiD involved in acid resistance